MEFHLRCSSTKQNNLILLDAFQSSFKICAIVSAYETKGTREDGTIINPHSHSYIKYDVAPTKQAISAFFKKWKHLIIKPTDTTAGYSHKLQKKTKVENIVYTIKAGDILFNTLGDLSIYKEKTEIINESKKLSSKEKLYNMYVLKFGITYPKSKYHLFKFIDEIYIYDWKKSPLAIGHKLSYSTHILYEIHRNIKDKNDELFEILAMNFYGIRDHNELIHNIDIEEARKYNTKCLTDMNCDFIDEIEDENIVNFD